MTNYDTIPQIIHDEEEADATTPTTTANQSEGIEYSSKLSKFMIGGAITLLVFLAGRYSTTDVTTRSTTTTTMLLPHLKGLSSSTTACSFKDCYASNCNQKVAPYTCLLHNGGPHGGCSATPWVPGSCKKIFLLFLFTLIYTRISEIPSSISFTFYCPYSSSSS